MYAENFARPGLCVIPRKDDSLGCVLVWGYPTDALYAESTNCINLNVGQVLVLAAAAAAARTDVNENTARFGLLALKCAGLAKEEEMGKEEGGKGRGGGFDVTQAPETFVGPDGGVEKKLVLRAEDSEERSHLFARDTLVCGVVVAGDPKELLVVDERDQASPFGFGRKLRDPAAFAALFGRSLAEMRGFLVRSRKYSGMCRYFDALFGGGGEAPPRFEVVNALEMEKAAAPLRDTTFLQRRFTDNSPFASCIPLFGGNGAIDDLRDLEPVLSGAQRCLIDAGVAAHGCFCADESDSAQVEEFRRRRLGDVVVVDVSPEGRNLTVQDVWEALGRVPDANHYLGRSYACPGISTNPGRHLPFLSLADALGGADPAAPLYEAEPPTTLFLSIGFDS